jgi:hypothetical protein
MLLLSNEELRWKERKKSEEGKIKTGRRNCMSGIGI